MATYTEVEIDGISLGTPINNRETDHVLLTYRVKTDDGNFISSEERGTVEEINARVAILQQYPKVIKDLWLVDIGNYSVADEDDDVLIMEWENSMTDYNGNPVGKK